MAHNPEHNFYQLQPGIFLLEVKGSAELALTFLRAQEFYESANPDFQGHAFEFEEYKTWYCSQSDTGTFSYGDDWRGFNLPSKAIFDCYATYLKAHEDTPIQLTPHDNFFLQQIGLCKRLSQNDGLENFYLIGVRHSETDALEHEIAHALFTVNHSYQQEMKTLVADLPSVLREKLYLELFEIGYAPSVHEDEAQAFLSTGLTKKMSADLCNALEPLIPKFQQVFQKFYTLQALPAPLVLKK